MHSSVHRSVHYLLTCVIAFGCVVTTQAAEPIALDVRESWHIDYATRHVQGLCVTADTFFISSVDRAAKSGYVYKIDRKTLRIEKEIKLAIGDQYHPGGMQLAGGRLWVPLAEYRAKSTSTILALDPTSLEQRTSFTIDDHIGALAADGRGTLYAGNWDCRVIYHLDEQGKVLEKTDNPTGVAYQDFELHDRLLWAAGRLKQDQKTAAVVDVLDTSTWKLKQRYTLSGKLRTGGSDFCREGFCKFGDDLFVMPEDGPNTTIYRFALPAK